MNRRNFSLALLALPLAAVSLGCRSVPTGVQFTLAESINTPAGSQNKNYGSNPLDVSVVAITKADRTNPKLDSAFSVTNPTINSQQWFTPSTQSLYGVDPTHIWWFTDNATLYANGNRAGDYFASPGESGNKSRTLPLSLPPNTDAVFILANYDEKSSGGRPLVVPITNKTPETIKVYVGERALELQ
ncbi:MAG: hypothetical protein AB7N71_01140 [Phycisphaerae bacterium]